MSNRPAFHAYTVADPKSGQKAHWTRVGSVFPHSKGDGFDLVLQAGVAVFGRIVCVTPRQDGELSSEQA